MTVWPSLAELAEGAASMPVPAVLLTLAVVLVSAKTLGELAEWLGQPAVVGELLAGVLLGGSVLGVVDPGVPVMHLLAELGVVLLLFEIGLETDLRQLVRVGGTSAVVAVAGVVLPFGLGFASASAFGLPSLTAVVVGAALTATSVGITARVLADLGRLGEHESQVVLGAAVIDDVIGLIILALVAELVSGGAVTLLKVGAIAGAAFGFLAVVLVAGRLVVPPLFRLLSRIGKLETLAVMGLVLAFLLAYLADRAGSAMIIGAFAAGVVLQPTPEAEEVAAGTARLAHLFVPVFFVVVGASVDVRTFLDPAVLGIGVVLVGVAVVGKFAAAYVPFWAPGRKSVIGVGMIPRGEVGLIFAQVGLTRGVLDVGVFSALTLMVMVTTFMAPPLLKVLFPPVGRGRRPGGLAELTTEA